MTRLSCGGGTEINHYLNYFHDICFWYSPSISPISPVSQISVLLRTVVFGKINCWALFPRPIRSVAWQLPTSSQTKNIQSWVYQSIEKEFQPGHSFASHEIVLCRISSLTTSPFSSEQYVPPSDLSHFLLCSRYPDPHGKPSTFITGLHSSLSSQSPHIPSLTDY